MSQALVIWFVKAGLIYGGLLGCAAVMTLAERKFSAFMQYRHGPNRVGPFGVLQPMADGVKFFFKEELVPEGATAWIFRMAPMMAALPAMLTIAVIPFAGEITLFGYDLGTFAVADVEVGVLYVLAVGGLGIYGIILGGWASNSKYSLLGGLRASAQMISYELSMILAILAVIAVTGDLSLRSIVAEQSGGFLNVFSWNIWTQPLAFLIFLITTFAETNRHPFDFAECEPELVGGFHTEYSSMKFALFFLGEYCAMIVMACMTTTLFLGGFAVPFWEAAPWWVAFPCFLAKTSFFCFLFIWVRWTLPRFRFDQLMHLGWKVLLPAALANLFLTGFFLALFGGH